MKAFDDLTDQELYDLSDEQLEYHKKIACAEAGAPIAVPPLPDRPVKPEAQPDTKAFRVKVGYSDTLVFLSAEKAQAVADAILAGQRLNLHSFGGHKYQYITPNSDKIEIESFAVFSEAGYRRVEKEVEAWALKQKEYDEAVSVRDKASKAQRSATEWIIERLEQARERIIQRMQHEKAFAEYHHLANQDAEVAYRFFFKAYGYPSGPMREHLMATYGFQAPDQEPDEVVEAKSQFPRRMQ